MWTLLDPSELIPGLSSRDGSMGAQGYCHLLEYRRLTQASSDVILDPGPRKHQGSKGKHGSSQVFGDLDMLFNGQWHWTSSGTL